MLSPPVVCPALLAVGAYAPVARPRRGFTLAELVVALAVGAAAFAAFALVTAQQERVQRELVARIRAHGQLREGLAILLSDVRPLSPGVGDVPAGGARDSSLELRSAVGTSVVCRIEGSGITTALESFVTPPTPGDTVWLFSQDTLGSSWLPLALTAVWTQPSHAPSDCGGHTFPASAYAARPGARARYALSLSQPVPPAVVPGTPIRVTRLVHYSLYRAPDARWYLGRREWSPSRGEFEVIQPVSGPYRPYGPEATQTSGVEFRYLDDRGESMPSGSSATERVASMVLTIRGPPRSDAAGSGRRDALSVSLALRNRR